MPYDPVPQGVLVTDGYFNLHTCSPNPPWVIKVLEYPDLNILSVQNWVFLFIDPSRFQIKTS